MSASWRMGILALLIVVIDQVTKLIVWKHLPLAEEKVIVEGFFRLVHWENTGAAYSMFRGYNGVLAMIAAPAVLAAAIRASDLLETAAILGRDVDFSTGNGILFGIYDHALDSGRTGGSCPGADGGGN